MSPDSTAAVEGVPQAADRTRVDLRHRNLQRYGDKADEMRAIFDHPDGWAGTLARFNDLAKSELRQQSLRDVGSRETPIAHFGIRLPSTSTTLEPRVRRERVTKP